MRTNPAAVHKPRVNAKGDARGETRGGSANATADRAIDILILFSEERPVWSVNDIAAHFAMPRSTIYRYVSSLRTYALIAEDERGGGAYRLGPRVFTLARVARSNTSVIRIAAPQLAALSERFGELVVLNQRVGREMITLDRIESRHRVAISYTRSQLLPWPATGSAKLLFAYAADAEREELTTLLQPQRYTGKTLATRAALLKELARIRHDAYALTDEERDEGVWGVAAPVTMRGEVQHCIAIAVPRFRITEKKRSEIITATVAAASAITRALAAMDF